MYNRKGRSVSNLHSLLLFIYMHCIALHVYVYVARHVQFEKLRNVAWHTRFCQAHDPHLVYGSGLLVRRMRACR
jgi:hypothetical protein